MGAPKSTNRSGVLLRGAWGVQEDREWAQRRKVADCPNVPVRWNLFCGDRKRYQHRGRRRIYPLRLAAASVVPELGFKDKIPRTVAVMTPSGYPPTRIHPRAARNIARDSHPCLPQCVTYELTCP